MRSSVLFMGGLLGRFGKVTIHYPGGCAIGSRPIDLHMKALTDLGADITDERGVLQCTGQLTGKQIVLGRVSVGATENTMLAAVSAKGETVIENASREPEIVDLQRFLNGMGAEVRGAGTPTITIQGKDRFTGTEHRVMPDRIVAGTYLVAAAATGGTLTLTHVEPRDLLSVVARLTEMGCQIKETKDEMTLYAPRRLGNLTHVVTENHPGLPNCNKGMY
jgi:UDP-N-acetylglucosamine 1-carboxyvinyltransferase